jgi:hypothetical protein
MPVQLSRHFLSIKEIVKDQLLEKVTSFIKSFSVSLSPPTTEAEITKHVGGDANMSSKEAEIIFPL